LPSDQVLHPVSLIKTGNSFKLENDLLAGKVNWKIRVFSK
jgi:hypothetical protein